jgi:hypothetical protein
MSTRWMLFGGGVLVTVSTLAAPPLATAGPPTSGSCQALPAEADLRSLLQQAASPPHVRPCGRDL